MERPWPMPSAFSRRRCSCSRYCCCSGEKSKFMVVRSEVGRLEGHSPLGGQLVERHFPIDPRVRRQPKYAFRKNVVQNLVGSTGDTERRAPVPGVLDRLPAFSERRATQAAQCPKHVQRSDRGALTLLRNDELCHRLLRSRHGPMRERSLIAVRHEAHAEVVQPTFSHSLADASVGNGWLAIHHRLLRQRQQVLPFDKGERSCCGAFLPQRREGDLPAPAYGTDAKRVEYAHLVEKYLVELGFARHLPNGTDLHAGLLHVDDEHREPLMLGHRRVGARESQSVIRKMTAGCPDLLARNEPICTVADGAGAHGGKIGPACGLGEELAPDLLTAKQGCDEAPPLLFSAASHDGAAAQLEAYREEIGAVQRIDVELRLLLEKDEILNFRSAQATELFRPRNG